MPAAERTDAPPPPFARALQDELVRAHVRLGRRRRRRQLGALAVVVIGLLAVVPVLLPGGGRDAAAGVLAVEPRADGSTDVAIVDPAATVDQIRGELEAKGIPNVTIGATTGPSLVGRFLSVGILGGDRVALSDDHRRMTVPAGFRGQLRIEVGIAGRPGEDYASPSDAFDEGEPLAGVADRTDAAAVLAEARRLGLRTRVVDETNTERSAVPAGARTRVAAMVAPDALLLVYATS